MGESEYSIYSPFDIEKHKKKYVNYLEVLIGEDGQIMYAVPSHLEKAILIACERYHLTKQQLSDSCPPEYYFDYLTWILQKAGAVAVWNNMIAAPSISKAQLTAIRRLKFAGLYKGPVPCICEKGDGTVNT